MVLLTGMILLALGLSLLVVWSAAVVQVLQGLVPLALLFFGAIFVLVGYSERKAAREFRSLSDGEKLTQSSEHDSGH